MTDFLRLVAEQTLVFSVVMALLVVVITVIVLALLWDLVERTLGPIRWPKGVRIRIGRRNNVAIGPWVGVLHHVEPVSPAKEERIRAIVRPQPVHMRPHTRSIKVEVS